MALIDTCKGTNKREENQKNFEFSRAEVPSSEAQRYKHIIIAWLETYNLNLGIPEPYSNEKKLQMLVGITKLYYLCNQNKYITIMTAIELRAELFREMSPLLDNESAMTKMLAFVKSLVPAKKTKAEAEWANRFVGAWKDNRSAEEIISDIREN